MHPISLKEIVTACGGRFIGDSSLQQHLINNIKIDSRQVGKGDLFIAIKGERFDGHDFIGGAYECGAACVISEQEIAHTPYIHVQSTFAALKDIAAYYRSLLDIKVIAITGSVGKTTAKEMISSVVSQKYNVLKTQGNFNNEFGLPQTIFNIEKHHDIAVVEMGMSGFGEIRRLSKIARPDVCVIMNIGESHIGNLGSRDGIFKAKCEIFEYMNDGALVVLNGDDDKLITLKDGSQVYFGKGAHNDISVHAVTSADMCGTQLTADYRDERFNLSIPKPGEYLIYPALAAALIGKKLGLSNGQIQRGIQSFVPANMRMDIQRTDTITIINDVYNACKQSLIAGASTLKHAPGRTVAIIGDILELGAFGQSIHHETGREMGALGIDLIICVGDLAYHMYTGAKETSCGTVAYYASQTELFAQLGDMINEGDTVFVKASRGMKFENIVNKLRELS